MKGRQLWETPDPWRQLAAAVVQQAVLDVRGEVLGREQQNREYFQAHAQQWLHSETAEVYLSLLGLDAGVVCERLG